MRGRECVDAVQRDGVVELDVERHCWSVCVVVDERVERHCVDVHSGLWRFGDECECDRWIVEEWSRFLRERIVERDVDQCGCVCVVQFVERCECAVCVRCDRVLFDASDSVSVVLRRRSLSRLVDSQCWFDIVVERVSVCCAVEYAERGCECVVSRVECWLVLFVVCVGAVVQRREFHGLLGRLCTDAVDDLRHLWWCQQLFQFYLGWTCWLLDLFAFQFVHVVVHCRIFSK